MKKFPSFLGSLFLFAFSTSLTYAAGINEVLPGPGITPAPEEPKLRNSIYADFGTTNPMETPNADPGYLASYHFGLGYGFGISRGFSLVLDAHYSTLILNANNPYLSNPNDGYYGYSYRGGDLHTLVFTVNSRFNFNDPDNPVAFYSFTGLGPGVVMLDPETTVTGASAIINTPGVTDTALAIRFGIGLVFKIDDLSFKKALSLFVEASFEDLFTSANKFDYINGYRSGALVQNILSVGIKFDP